MIYKLWSENRDMFEKRPLPKSFKPVSIGPDTVLESFGCSRLLKDGILKGLSHDDAGEDVGDDAGDDAGDDCKDDIACNNREFRLETHEVLNNDDDAEDDDGLADFVLEQIHADEDCNADENCNGDEDCNGDENEEGHVLNSSSVIINLDDKLKDKIQIAPYPCRVKTKEEVILFLQLCSNQKGSNKLDLCRMVKDWNNMIVAKLRENDEPKEVFRMFTFKTVYHLQKFYTTIDRKSKAKKILSERQDEFLDLQSQLRQRDTFPQLGAITEAIRKESIAETTDPDPVEIVLAGALEENRTHTFAVEEVHSGSADEVLVNSSRNDANDAAEGNPNNVIVNPSVIEKIGPSSSSNSRKRKISRPDSSAKITKLEDLYSDYGEELIGNLADRQISVCSKCLMIQKKGSNFVNGHGNKTCLNPQATLKGERSWDTLQRTVRKLRSNLENRPI